MYQTLLETDRRSARLSELSIRIALVLLSLFFSLALLELGCRVVRSGPAALTDWPNIARERMGNSEDGSGSCGYAYEATLGWTTPQNCSSNRSAHSHSAMPSRRPSRR